MGVLSVTSALASPRTAFPDPVPQFQVSLSPSVPLLSGQATSDPLEQSPILLSSLASLSVSKSLSASTLSSSDLMPELLLDSWGTDCPRE